MVHGGGHHQNQSWGGGHHNNNNNRDWGRHGHQQNVMFFNNNYNSNPFNWGGGWGNPYVNNNYYNSWGWGNSWWGWNRSWRSNNYDNLSNDQSDRARGIDDEYESQKCDGETIFSCMNCLGIFVPMILFLIFLSITSPIKETFSLNQNEARTIPIVSSYLIEKLNVKLVGTQLETSNNDMTTELLDSDQQLLLYHTLPNCPAATGPTRTSTENSDFLFNTGDYEYFYYYLLEGSIIEATLSAKSGGGDLILFSGEDVFKYFESDDNYNTWESQIISKSYASTSHKAILRYKVEKAGVYYIIYQNALSRRFSGFGTLEITSTSYNLSEVSSKDLACSVTPNDTKRKHCKIHFPFSSKIGCIFVVASVPSAPKNNNVSSQNSTLTTGLNNDNIVFSISVKKSRRYSFICISCFVPIIIFSLFLQQSKSSTTNTTSHDFSEVNDFTFAESNPPPANNPAYNETIPVATVHASPAEDVESSSETIPIVTATAIPQKYS